MINIGVVEMSSRIKQVSNGLVNLFLIPLILVTLFGGIQLILSNFQGVGSLTVKMIDAIFFVAIIFLSWMPVFQKVVHCWNIILNLCKKHRTKLFLLLLIITLVWQIAVVCLISGNSGWDPGVIARTAIGQQPSYASEYFSVSPNTMLLLFVERGLWIIAGSKLKIEAFIVYLNFLNIFLIDSAVAMICLITKKWFGNMHAKLLFVISWLLMMMSPWVALPYSDTWAFFLTALYVYLGDCLIHTHRVLYKCILATGLGILLTFDYYMKPSLIITAIAAAIIFVLKIISMPKFIKNIAILISVCFISIGVGAGAIVYRTILQRQNIVVIEAGRSHPLTHFMAMGMQGDGGFYGPDVLMDMQIKSPAAREKANVKLIKERYISFDGLTNYEKFLMRKQVNNMADGSFAWGVEGKFIKTNHPNSRKLNQTLIRRLFAKNGTVQANNFEYRFFAQLIWCVCLIGILFTIRLTDWKIQFLKYGIVGFMLFLLLFEGGRSRYIIQFLPLIIMLATVGLGHLNELCRKIEYR